MIELDRCIEKLTAEDEADRIYAAEDIACANSSKGVAPLLKRLPVEPSRAVREAVFSALRRIECDSVIEGCLALLKSDDSFLRNEAVELLRSRGAKAIPHLQRAYRDGDNDERKFVIDVLACFDHPGLSEIYEQALRDADVNVVITAVECVGRTRKSQYRQRIEALMIQAAQAMLLGACLETLAEIGSGESLAVIRSRLAGPGGVPAYLLPSYIKAVGALGGAGDCRELAEMIEAPQLEAHVLSALAALRSRHSNLALPESLAQRLQDVVRACPSPLTGHQAVRLLGGLSHRPGVLEFLRVSLEHRDKTVRIAAVETLRNCRLGGLDAILAERAARETDEEVLQVLRGDERPA